MSVRVRIKKGTALYATINNSSVTAKGISVGIPHYYSVESSHGLRTSTELHKENKREQWKLSNPECTVVKYFHDSSQEKGVENLKISSSSDSNLPE